MNSDKPIPVQIAGTLNPEAVDPRALYSGDLVLNAIANTKERDVEIITQDFLPLMQLVAALEVAIAKFDECVISRGAGMIDNLNDRQKRMYAIYSDFVKFCRVYRLRPYLKEVKPFVISRNAAYNNFMEGKGSYDELLNLARQHPDNIPLINRVMEIQRGGRHKDDGIRWILDHSLDMRPKTSWNAIAHHWKTHFKANPPEDGTQEAEAVKWIKKQNASDLGRRLMKEASRLGYTS